MISWLARLFSPGYRQSGDALQISPVYPEELKAVSALCRRSFFKVVAGTLPRSAKKTFVGVVRPNALAERLLKGDQIWVARAGRKPLGMIELKAQQHIVLFFIDPAHRRQGIGRRLLAEALRHLHNGEVTVNASLPSVSAYEAFGFVARGGMIESGGLIAQPMSGPVNVIRSRL